jgi:hypothetical protein
MAMKKKIDAGTGVQFKFETVGQSLQGYYVGSFEHNGDYGQTQKHLFKNDKGLWTVFGQKHLIDMLNGIEPGILVRVTFAGNRPSKKKGFNPMKLFEIEYDEEDRLDASSVADAASGNEDGAESEYADASDEQETEEEEIQEPVRAAPVSRPAPKAAAPARPASNAISDAARARASALMPRK